MKSKHSGEESFSMNLKSEERKSFDKNQPKKKKIIITTTKSSKKNDSNENGIQVNNENDFMKTISKLLKESNHCQGCIHMKQKSGSFICTNFQALWHHRDNQFNNFTQCKYKEIKKLTPKI